MATPSVALVHLVRASNPATALERFISSYRAIDAGVAHELVLVCKGFHAELPAELGRTIAGLRPRLLFLPDRGFDIGPYARAAKELDHDVVAYCNSFSRILAPEWLRIMVDALDQPGVGLVGATGSWQSHFSSGFGPGWWNPFPRNDPSRWPRWVGRRYRWLRYRLTYPAFPNPHIRSNAFALRRVLFTSVRVPPMITKQAAYRFESARRSLTRQVMARGLRPVVVGRNGLAHDWPDWFTTNTFWSGEQENLLVADNQTDRYAAATDAGRLVLERAAWRAGPPPTHVDTDPMRLVPGEVPDGRSDPEPPAPTPQP